ncbi:MULTISPECIES: LytTR family DNA-binding domain-containing protein [unclassified Spirosoma]|uniref:LytR/AlgR family response regulator transcription factor n=1 Tax=unclassified Spirosoma TaxID=2621999 RepID=UPI000B0592D6|nr:MULTISPECIES: LytTR family DNA-binding domain-containing protein [unclassified Spirosoma]MBN8821597.1 LytTR family transcriptional regulator [Spirosoma sp.]
MKRSSAAQIQHKFEPDQILYLVGDVNYSTVYLCDGTVILSSRTLKWYHTKWPDFIRIHKATLINPQYVHSCHVISCIMAQITMQNGATMTISRRRIHAVLDHLQASYSRSAMTHWNDYSEPHYSTLNY